MIRMQRGTGKIVQIVPSNLPGHCGLGDYAFHLASELRDAWNIETSLLVISEEYPEFKAYREFAAIPAPVDDAEAIKDALLRAADSESGDPCTVLLHASGYSYDRVGAPEALVEGLARAMAAAPRLVLATMFHELYESIPPYRRSYWTIGARQRRVVAATMGLTDIAFTNCAAHHDVVERWNKSGREISVLPVFSNLGESAEFLPFEARQPKMMVLGQPRSRGNAYGRFAAGLARAVKMLGVEQVCDVGSPVENCPQQIAGCPVTELGWQPPEEIAQLLSQSRFGFVAYTPDGQAKSGIMAAICAHGAVPVLAGKTSAKADGLILGTNCWSSEAGGALSLGQAEKIGIGAHAWYRRHTLKKHGEWVASALGSAVDIAAPTNAPLK
jgi:hypothetical protein